MSVVPLPLTEVGFYIYTSTCNVISNLTVWLEFKALTKNIPVHFVDINTRRYLIVINRDRLYVMFKEVHASDLMVIVNNYKPAVVICSTITDIKTAIFREEIFLDTHTLATLKDITVKKRYMRFEKQKNIVCNNILDVEENLIVKFLSVWSDDYFKRVGIRTDCSLDKLLLSTLRTRNDLQGAAYIDKLKDIVIGVDILIKINKSIAHSLVSKCLRGYKHLGVGMYVNQAKSIQKKYDHLCIGGCTIKSQCEFKKAFLKGGFTRFYYSKVCYKSSHDINLTMESVRDFWKPY